MYVVHHIFKSHHPIRHVKSFGYAFEGIFHALLHEPNFRVQVIIAILSVILGRHFKISNTEWAILTLSNGFLLSAEMLNTVVEEFIDNLIKEKSSVVKVIKDLVAGFVLTAALTALIIFMLIFGHRLPSLLN